MDQSLWIQVQEKPTEIFFVRLYKHKRLSTVNEAIGFFSKLTSCAKVNVAAATQKKIVTIIRFIFV